MVFAVIVAIVALVVLLAVGRFVWRLKRGTVEVEPGGSAGTQLSDAVRGRK